MFFSEHTTSARVVGKVVLGGDLTDEFVQQILAGNHLNGHAVLVDDDRQVLLPLRECADYSAILTNGYKDDLRPWEQRHAADVTDYRAGKFNATPAIPPQVLDPLLAGALFFVETASTDILATRTEHQRLWKPLQPCGGSARITAENLQRLTQALDGYRLQSRPLPLLRDARAEPLDDPLAAVNIRLIGRHARVRLGLTIITKEQRELLLTALRDLGVPLPGVGDIVVGDPDATPYGRSQAGNVYVIYGQRGTSAPELDVSHLSASQGTIITGFSGGDLTGTSVAVGKFNAGSPNGGCQGASAEESIAIGAPGATQSGQSKAGEVYVIYGTDLGRKR
jgi:hypothetical protein